MYTTISGEVIKGKKIGRTIGFPTANISLPRTSTSLQGATYGLEGTIRGKSYFGIGVYLDFLDLFEAHFFDFDDDIYGETISVTPLMKIRENQKFSSLDALKKQIEEDRSVMKKWIASRV